MHELAETAAMARCSLLQLLLALGNLSKGLTAVVKTQQTVVATVGEQVQLSCQLMQSKHVLQVTWQKMLPEGKKNLATYSKYSGLRLTDGFQGKLEFNGLGLENCSILISKVIEQDEGCYRCLFNTYPHGAFTGRTCLMVSELHEPILRVQELDSTEELVVSCSATGRSAPTVRLNVTQPQLHLSRHNTTSVNNNNGSVTVTTTAVLSGIRNSSAQVGCAVRALSEQKEVFMMIPEVKQTPAGGFNEEPGSEDRHSDFTLIIVTVCVCVILFIVVIFILVKHMCSSSLPQGDFENSIAIKDKTPLVEQKYEHVRQRTSVKKSLININRNTLAPKKLMF